MWFNVSLNNKCRDRKCKIGPQCGRTIFFQKSRDKTLVDFAKFWDYLKNCTSSDFSTKKKRFCFILYTSVMAYFNLLPSSIYDNEIVTNSLKK